MSDRKAWLILLLVGAYALVGVWRMRLPNFWGDSATYYLMAWSVADDLDLRYEARDLLRAQREMKRGPEGVFLKKTTGALTVDRESGFPWVRRVRPDEERLYFAKPFLHALVAAPFVRISRTRGLFILNAVAFGVALLLAYAACRRDRPPGAALLLTLGLFLGTLTPLFLVWPAPEMLYFALAAVALAAWRLDQPIVAAVLLGAAAYAKPPNIFLTIPLLAAPLIESGLPIGGRLRESVRRGLVVAATTVLFFALNVAFTGELNYQGGERKTFYERFPYQDFGVTWENTGIWMSQNSIGPQVQGRDEAAAIPAEPPRKAGELRVNFVWNLAYFWIGRFGGVVPYFLPAAVSVLLFLVVGPRDRRGALAFLALVVSYLFYIWMIPDNWYGGSGTIGNRYFLMLLPLALFVAPRGRETFVAAAAVVSVALLLRPIFWAPLYHSLRPGAHATRATFRFFPPELSMLNDLSIFTEPWRKKQPIGDFGDAASARPTDPTAYYLYFLDNGTLGQEPRKEQDVYVQGFWLRGGEEGEVILRVMDLAPIVRARFRVTGGPAGDRVTIEAFGARESLEVGAGMTRELALSARQGFPYKDTYLSVLRFRSTRSGVDRWGRNVGSFVQILLDTGSATASPGEVTH